MKFTVAPYKAALGLCTVALGATVALPSLLAQTSTNPNAVAAFPTDLQQKIKYVFILYPENRSVDGLYGNVPGVNGLSQATPSTYTQTSRTGTPLANLPQPTTSGIPGMSGGPDTRFPSAMPNQPYDLIQNVPFASMQGDMIHRFYTEQYQINDPNGRYKADPKNAGGNAMNKFSVWSDNPGLVLTHYDAQNLGEGLLTKLYTVCDNNFHSGFGGSFLNHQFLIAARSPVWQAAPAEGSPPPATGSNVTVYDANGYPAVLTNNTLSDGFLTNDAGLPAFTMSNANQSLGAGDYWAVNTLRPLRGPAGGYTTSTTGAGAPTSNTALSGRLPLQYHDTIGDRLSAAGINWAWYAGGWNNAKAGQADFLFQFHHHPFAFFAKYALATTPTPATGGAAAVPGTDSAGSAAHLKDEDADFYPALTSKSVLTDLPQVIFVKPIGENNQHPGYAAVQAGEDWVAQAVAKIQSSKAYKNSVIFITYDEHGGMWDHVTPPRVDFWGPGLRTPLTVVSPFVKHGFVDHTQYETNSLLTFIEGLYGLPPLNQHDANAIAPISPFVGQPDLVVRGQARQPMSYTMPAYGQPAPTSVTGDMNGLTYNPATGVLSGTPTNAGSYTMQVQSYSNGAFQTTTMRMDVLPMVTAARPRLGTFTGGGSQSQQ